MDPHTGQFGFSLGLAPNDALFGVAVSETIHPGGPSVTLGHPWVKADEIELVK
ncbi:hypothetical protein [Streptomyces vinaceus]|uniref:hypothetical protein n=1 Tax=Streptomyces vinaceus TaxID=1960 RepID=UPI0038071A87